MPPSSLRKRTKVIVAILVLAALGVGVFVWFRAREQAPAPLPVAEKVHEPTHEVIGTSVEGRNIDAYTYGNGAIHLLFVGGVHGGYEWNSVVLAYEIMDYLKEPNVIPDALTVTVIPSLNPDGVYAVVGTEGRFSAAAVPADDGAETGLGRFNAHDVDLNRNFDCKWQPESMWRGNTVSAGTAAFSEPEAQALRNFILAHKPTAVVFWHSQSNAVYASECEAGILSETRTVMNTYASAAGYPAVDTFDAYEITGDAEGWLASIGIPAVTVELSTHKTTEREKNIRGVQALLDHYNTQL